MFTPQETRFNTESLDQARGRVSEGILPNLSSNSIKRVVPVGSTVDLLPCGFAVVRSGCLSVELEGRVVVILEEGDLVGSWILSGPGVSAVAKGVACEITEFNEDDLLSLLSNQPNLMPLWHSYLGEISRAFLHFFGESCGHNDMPSPRIKSYGAGERILEQGNRDGDVYSIVEGAAEVIVDGVRVGTIGTDEIFGVIAALTGAPRSATVIAQKPVLAMAFNKDDFQLMLRSHPTLVIKMMEDMARVMRELNERVVSISQGSGRSDFV